MPTVLDEFVLLIGLDPSRFEEGRRALDAQLDRAKAGLAQFGEKVEDHGAKISEVFSLTKNGVTGLLASFIGAEAAAFVDRVATMDARTMQLAHSIGTSTRELSLWQNMVRAVGGEAADASATLAGLQDAFMGMRMGTQMPSPAFASLLSRAGIDFRTATPAGALGGLMGFLGGQPEQQQRFWLQQVPGMNENMMFLLMEIMRHPDKMRNLREELEKLGLASEKSGEQALELAERTGEMKTAWESLSRVLFPFLTSLITQMTALIQKFTGGSEGVKDFLFGPKDSPGIIDQWSRGLSDRYFGPTPAPPEGQRGAFIMGAAASLGLDPNVALAVAKSEGFFAWSKSANAQSFIPGEQSFGDFQLHYRQPGERGPGLGNIFSSQTGLDARDPRNWMAADRFALEWAKTHGWGDFHGARGVTGAGVGKGASINIGTINVTSSKADPAAVADQIPESMRRYSMLAGINTGLT